MSYLYGPPGHLVSKRDADKYNIQSLDDFKRDEVKKAFDKNGDGKADLTACPPGWGCENVIAHHMKVYDLDAYINPVKASYEAGRPQRWPGTRAANLFSSIPGHRTGRFSN